MPKTTPKYTNGEVTIVRKPGMCIHSALCWRGLRDLFNPGKRQWIEPTGASPNKLLSRCVNAQAVRSVML